MKYIIGIVFILFFIPIDFVYGDEAGPDITQINEAHAAFKAKTTGRNYSRLIKALDAYEDDVTTETVLAYTDLLKFDIEKRAYRRMRKTAVKAVDHYEPVADYIPRQYLDTRSLAAIALFNSDHDTDAMLEMAHVYGRARQIHNPDWSHPDWATKAQWSSEAWLYAMEAYFLSVNRRYPDEDALDAIKASYSQEDHQDPPKIASRVKHKLPHCKGELDMKPKIRYPKDASYRRMFGAVILEIELDSTGAVINPKVRAAIPFEGFSESVVKTASQWTYVPEDAEIPGETCRLQRKNLVVPFTFSLG